MTTRAARIFAAFTLVLACGDDDMGSDAGPQNDASVSDGGASDTEGARDAGTDATSAADVGEIADAGGEDAGTDAGPQPACGPGLSICEDFESANLGEFPAGWARREGGWGGRTIGVADDDAWSGAQALKIESGANGAQWMTFVGDLGDLRTRHFGRMYVKVNQPAPWPTEGLVHGDLFEARGPYGGGTNRVRWGVVKRWLELDSRQLQWIYNVQRDGPEFASQTAYVHPWPEGWFCMEWSFDEGEQSATLWLDGEEMSEITQSRGTSPEIPVFSDISVGWANYQQSAEDFIIWIDDVAFDDERIGCD